MKRKFILFYFIFLTSCHNFDYYKNTHFDVYKNQYNGYSFTFIQQANMSNDFMIKQNLKYWLKSYQFCLDYKIIDKVRNNNNLIIHGICL